MPELRLPTPGDPWLSWARELVVQLRRQFVPVLRRLPALAPWGLQAQDGAGTVFTLPWLKMDTAILTLANTATATATALVRPGLTFGVFAQNLTAITGAGLVEYKIGTTTPPDDDAWHDQHTLTLDTLEDETTWKQPQFFGITPPVLYTAATDIVLTGVGGNLGTGTIQLFALTLDFTAYP